MKVRWFSAALQDLVKLRHYIAADNPAAAAAARRIIDATSKLETFPAIGRAGRIGGARELISGLDYLLVYRASARTVDILRLFHGARNWPDQVD